MTLTGFLDCRADRELKNLASATTLQDLFDRAVAFLSRRGIDHAVLISVPSPRHSVLLPVLPIEPELRCTLAAAVHANVHPAATLGPIAAMPKQLSRLGIETVGDLRLEDLLDAFDEAGMRDVYELMLEPSGNARVVLEVARVGGPIGGDDLSEIQHVMNRVPRMLPEWLTRPPRDAGRRTNCLVR